MAIKNDRVKTSLFLTILMILTPVATAATVNTFSDGAQEVIIEFKDGFSLNNNTDGGFYVNSDETITSATVNISSDPMMYSTSSGYSGLQSSSWDSTVNNGATTFDNVSNFVFNKDTLQNSVQFNSESLVTDFEFDDGGFDNSTTNQDLQGNPIAWDYNAIGFKELNQGPDNCASGDMCWGTNIFDGDYTNDLDTDPNPYVDQVEFRLTTPTIYLDNSLNDTFLRFSSWHAMEAKFNQQGDYYYDDCAYLEIQHTPVGQFTGEQTTEALMINFPQTTGIGPTEGLFAKDDASYSRDRISPECGALENNFFGFAGTSVSPFNLDGWASVAANLAPYLGSYVKISFVLFHADAPGNVAQFDTPGWYIDDVTIGEKFVQEGTMVIENLQAPQDYDEKTPNGYGLLFVDTFEPADSSLSYTIRDAVTGVIAEDSLGYRFENLQGSVIELWGLDADSYPYIDIEVTFSSGSNQISTPIFYGYTMGTEMGLTFNDLTRFRGLSVSDGEFDYVHDSGLEIKLDSSTFLSNNNGEFSKPIYGLNVSGGRGCQLDLTLDSPMFASPDILIVESLSTYTSPIFEFELTINFNADCVASNLWVELLFGHHMSGIELDYGTDGVNEWEFSDPGYGMFGLQNMFYEGEINGVSQGSSTAKLTLDVVTGTVVDGFFLIPKGASLSLFDVEFANNDIFNTNNTNEGFELSLVVGSTSDIVTVASNQQSFHLYDTVLNKDKPMLLLEGMISDPSVPVIKTDQSGIDWIRVGFKSPKLTAMVEGR